MASELYTRLQQEFDYQPVHGSIDELLTGDNEVSPTWQYLIDSMTALGGTELVERQRKAANLLRDDGATFRAYSKNGKQIRDNAWRMDLVPFVIDSARWQEIETGLLERAELLNLILRDIYGKRELVQRGVIPPEVIFGHRGFLRACQGISLPGEQQLILHATELIRTPSGEMCVLADRTQAPSGAGYALENRIVMTRILPSVFRDSNVHRLSSFFQSLRAKLLSLAPQLSSPNIAIFTPGVHNEAYFEHAYIANFLGFELVQASDLTVRNNILWMKTLDGWSRVDVLLRRIDDDWCDPVELRGDSMLGVPGLLEVARAGNVVIANPLGSGILESPALLAYMPDISRHFFGRDLQLPSVGTWWCGDSDQLPHVVENFDNLVIKPVSKGGDAKSVCPADLDEQSREELLRQVMSKPSAYVAQDRVVPSHLPALTYNKLSPRPAILRSFTVATGDSYRVMPGGLTRIGSREGLSLLSNQLGSVSKDTWIVASEQKKGMAAATGIEAPVRDITRVTGLPSRVVENMFWFGRYTERSEFGLRMTRTLLLQAADIGSSNEEAQQFMLDAVIGSSDSATAIEAMELSPVMDQCEDLLPVILDPERRESLIGSVDAMLSCADETKELMTFDTQRVLNQIREEARQLASDLRASMLSAPEEVLSPILTSLLAMSGILQESVNRGTGWNFMDLGRRLERGIQTVNQLQFMLTQPLAEDREYFALESLLVSNESLVIYRRIYRGRLDLRNVLELMLLDENNPRGLLFQLKLLGERLRDLPALARDSRELENEARYLLEACSRVQLTRLEDLCTVDAESGRRLKLEDFCQRIEYLLSQTAVALSEKFFEKPIVPQQLLRQTWGDGE